MIRRKTNKFESRKMTLEQRISRLEYALSSNCKSRKFEDANESETFSAAESRHFKSALYNRDDISVIECSADPDAESWFVIIADEDGDYETSYGIYKINGAIEAWEDDRARYAKVFSSVAECANKLDYNYDNDSMGW